MNFIKIGLLLNLTTEQVQQKYVDMYFKWCAKWANELGYETQALLSNTAICNWFNSQYEDLQHQAFETLHSSFGKITIYKMRMIYNALMSDLYKNYPKPLFEAAKKIRIENQLPYDPAAN